MRLSYEGDPMAQLVRDKIKKEEQLKDWSESEGILRKKECMLECIEE